MLAQEREIREAYERQKKIFERTFAELGIETPMPALGNPNAKKRFGIGWVVFCILAGIWLALILRPWIIILLSIGPKEFIRLFF